MACTIPPGLKWVLVALLVLFVFGDSLVDWYSEAICVQNGQETSSVISGSASCTAEIGLRFVWTGWSLYSWTNSYDGEMALNRMNGKGIYRSPSGASYDGHFLENLRVGPGTFYSADKSTTWSGFWQEDRFTGSKNMLTVKRADIFNKVPATVLQPIAQAAYLGETDDAVFHGAGSLEFSTQEPNSTIIASFDGYFTDGSLNHPTGDIALRWGHNSPLSVKNTRVLLRNWSSNWQSGSHGVLVLNETYFFSWSNGALQQVLPNDHNRPVPTESSVIDRFTSELHAVKQVLEAVRAVEWHFVFHRALLDPIVPILDASTLEEKTLKSTLSNQEEIKEEL